MTRGTGRCGNVGCERPCPRDEDFCSDACEQQARAEDEQADRDAVGYDSHAELR